MAWDFAVAAVVAVAALELAAAHICIIDPPQRGDPLPSPIGPGEDACYRRTPYCGGVPLPNGPRTTYTAGAQVKLLFQQNLNHFDVASPGRIDIAISYNLDPVDEDSDWSILLTLDDYPGGDMVTQTNFSTSITMPTKPADHALLRFRYTSHNKGEIDPANNSASVFYNCADIRLEANSHGLEEKTDVSSVPITSTATTEGASPANGCTTADVWAATATEKTSNGIIQHSIYYDARTKAVKWNREGPMYQAGVNVSLTTLSLYGEGIPGQPPAAHPEYLIGMGGPDKCVLYGADPMYLWAYGPIRNQILTKDFTKDGATFQEWTTPDKLHSAVVKVRNSNGNVVCEPVSEEHPGRFLQFSTFEPNAPLPEGIFNVPKICKKPVLGHGLL